MAAAADRAPCSLCLTWLPLQNFEDGSTIRCVDCRKLMKSVYRQAQEQHVKIRFFSDHLNTFSHPDAAPFSLFRNRVSLYLRRNLSLPISIRIFPLQLS